MGSPFRRQRSLRLDLDQIGPSKIDQNLSAPKPGILQFPDDSNQYDFTAASLEQGDCIGFGTFGGVVNRMVHKQTGREMAVKRIRAHEVVKDVRDKALSELRMIIQSQGCEDIVRFYGALFQNGDCWICMELMDCSLEKMYPLVFACGEHLPQRVVGFVTAAVVRALNYLKQVLNIIHRDVKPSNILLDKRGSVKLCDFGISGYLVNSIAETQDVGCQFYMAPERLTDGKRYDIRSDVWSLGISLVEICIGHFPYVGLNSVFDQFQIFPMQNLKENLKALPWKELQMRAKASGIRANQQKTKIIEQLLMQQQHHDDDNDNDNDNMGKAWRHNKLNFPEEDSEWHGGGGGGNVCSNCNESGHFSRECPHGDGGGEGDSELHNNNNNDDDDNDNNTDTGNKLNLPSGEEESELHSGNLNGGFWEGQFANGGFDNHDDDDGGGDNGQQAVPSSSSKSATLRQKRKRASQIERRGQKKMWCKRPPRPVQKKQQQQQQQHQQQSTEPQYELKAVHAYFKSDAGKEAYFVSWLDYRNKEWVLSVDMEGVELTNQFSREAGTHSTLKALCGKPVSTDQKNLIEADPYFQKLKNKFGAQLPAIESNKSDIWWAPNTQTELKRDAIKTLPEFIARCMSA